MAADMSLNAQGLDRIIRAVGERYERASLDRSALRGAIQASGKRAEIISQNRHGARARKRINQLTKIRKAAERLASLLKSKNDAVDMIVLAFGETPQVVIGRLISGVETIEDVLGEYEPHSQHGNLTEVEWLAGVELPCVFEEHFDRKAGVSRNKDGQPDGPCVRFIESSMHELGMKYGGASIIRAMTKHRALRNRRRDVRRGQNI